MNVDMHCHSSYSADGESSPREILLHVKKVGLGGIAITDHNELRGSVEAHKLAKGMDLFTVRGMEVSSSAGHILAYGISEPVPRGLSPEETIERITKLGGVAVAAHPFRWKNGLDESALLSNRFGAFEARNGHSLKTTNRKIERMASQRNIGITGGSDAHRLADIGRAVTVFGEDHETEDDFIQAIQNKRTGVGGSGRSTLSSITFAARCVGGWISRGMKKI
jgi:predicted metal-dependent phosphoesterase TrpH